MMRNTEVSSTRSSRFTAETGESRVKLVSGGDRDIASVDHNRFVEQFPQDIAG